MSEKRVVEVRGTSLLGLVNPGTKLTLLVGAYACNAPKRGDWVAHRYGGNPDPIAKVIAAVPGDQVHLAGCVEQDVVPRQCLFIGGRQSRTSDGTPHFVQPQEARLLGPYLEAAIPSDTYLLLSNRPSGTVDSRQFGLVAREDLLGMLRRQE